MKSPAISVVIPLYNKKLYIERTLRSILVQTFKDFEVIVVDDGSTDKSGEIVRSLRDSRIRLIRQKNAGASAARNRGIFEAKAEYVAFLDADDEWKPEFLDMISQLRATYPQAGIFATSFEVKTPDMKTIVHDFGLPETSVLSLSQYIACCVKHKCSPICSSSILVSKHLFKRIGGFPVGIERGEDIDTWFRLAAEAPLAYCTRTLAIYWVGLPFSVCQTFREVKESPLLISLEDKLSKGLYKGDMCEQILDYIAWHRSLTIDRLLLRGKGTEVRRYLKFVSRSKQFRRQCHKLYVLSFAPTFVIKHLKKIKII